MKREVARRWITGVSLGLVAYVAMRVYLAGREDLPPPQNTVPVVVGHGIARGERISSHSWSIDYDKITTSADQTFVTVDGVHDGIVYKDGKPYLRLRAAHVTVNMITHDFTASGPLHIDSVNKKKPRAFDTNSAVWTEATQHLDLESPIVVTSPGSSLHVQKLSLDVRTGNLHLEHIDGSFRE
jgi:hypothetical protein